MEITHFIIPIYIIIPFVLIFLGTVILCVVLLLKNSRRKNEPTSTIPTHFTENIVLHYNGGQTSEEIQTQLQELEQLRKEREDIEIQFQKKWLREKERQEANLNKYKKDLEASRDKCQSLQTELKDMEKQKSYLEAEIEERTIALEKKYQKELEELNKKRYEAQKNEPKADNVAIEELQKEIHRLHTLHKEETSVLKQDFLKETEKVVQSYEKIIVSMKKEIKDLNMRNDSLRDEIERLKNNKNNK